MMFAGDACKAIVGPKPALFHHFCYNKYCETILKAIVADEEDCNYCMDCQHPKTKGPVPLTAPHDMTEGAELSEQHLPNKRTRGASSTAASSKNK